MAQRSQFPHPDGYPSFNLGDLSPDSPDSITMPGRGRPSDVGMQPFARYASLPGHPQGTGELMSDLQALASGHGQQGFTQNPGLHPMISQFIHDRGPWTPLNVEKRPAAGLSFNQGFPSFNEFRNPPPPSEADTVGHSVGGIFSDSGYGSMARQSVGNPSVYGEADQTETQSIISRLQAMGQDSGSKDEPRKREARSQRSTLATSSARSIVCPVCNASVKTNSELKKHEARHNKPFKCTVPGCPKATEGFSTNNDLDRHRRCVHKLRMGDETVYRCDVDQCKDKDKDWPRQDNFRQHLRRKHNLENVDLARFTFKIPGPVGFGSSHAGEEAVATGSDSASQAPWTGMDHAHVAPENLINGAARFGQMDSTVLYHGQPPMGARSISTSDADRSQYQSQGSQDSTRLHSNMEPVLSGLSMPRPAQQGTPISGQFSGMNQPACVAPDVLSHTRPEARSFGSFDTRTHPRGVAHLGVDDAPQDLQDDAQSEAEEVESNGPDAMEVDDAAQDSASDEGANDSDSEDEEPAKRTLDRQPDLLGAQYSQTSQIHIKTSPSQIQLGSDTPRPVEFDDEKHASAVIQSLIKKGKLEEMLKKLGYAAAAPEEAETKDQKPLASSSAASDSGHVTKSVYKCHECLKTFHRRCELKKHQKRHAKPYACTFAKCDKKFGSKNDWKRHENSQHFQLEIWRCAEKVAAAAPNRPEQQQQQQQAECGKVCHRRESLKAHLERDHHVRDLAVLDKKLADCRMGRNFESRFWCGFCQKTIEPTGKGGPAHSERFDHIDDHFNGRGMPKADIREWKHVESDFVDSPHGSPLGRGRREDGLLGGRGRSGWVSIARSGNNSRKRAYGGDGDGGALRAKRFKDRHGKVVFWTCCFCGNYWRMGTTPSCNGCDHAYCDNCKVFEDDGAPETEPEPQGQPQVQSQVQQGQGQGQMQGLVPGQVQVSLMT